MDEYEIFCFTCGTWSQGICRHYEEAKEHDAEYVEPLEDAA